MIKISALNEESEEESGSEEEVTREALEQIALQQYIKALELQRKGQLSDATQLLRDLLDTELLYDIKKPEQGEKITGPLFNLKYLCFKNLAAMLTAANDIDAAIDCYWSASELDDSDVTLWHRLGQLCLRVKRYEMSLHSFKQGVNCNPRHWPCLDKIVTLLLGLDCKEECISTIYETLQLDPGYLRGLVYRRHIYKSYSYIRDYMEYLNPIYKWTEEDDEPIDNEKAEKLLAEAEEINVIFLEQQKNMQFKYILPNLKLKMPITSLTWRSVGESLIDMHNYMTENCYSHACKIELVEIEEREEPMEVSEESKETEQVENKTEENNTDSEKNGENVIESENNDMSDKDKATTDTEKVESDVESAEPKVQKKVRRRGGDLSSLQQWEWCNKRRSGRKKTVNRQDPLDDNIYDTLRRMVPVCLAPDVVQKKEDQNRKSIDMTGLDTFFEGKESEKKKIEEYFGTDNEKNDVKQFITKYIKNKSDIIDMLKDLLTFLADKWRVPWPQGLPKIFVEANKCYNNHIDIPSCTDDNHEDLINYTVINILAEEFSLNEKLSVTVEEKETHDLSVIETIGIGLNQKPHIFSGIDCLELMLRHLWIKLHIHLLSKQEVFALDCLYQLSYEFEAMGEDSDKYELNIINFTFKPIINENEILTSIRFLERNKKLATVMDLYDRGNYEDVLSIILDSFEQSKSVSRSHEDEMTLDFAVQLSLILDTYWALNNVDECFKWSLICLHEALKHYFRYTTGSTDYEKWTLTVVKILCSMEHILTTEGLSCLDAVSQKELSQGLEDLIRIIGHQVETNAAEMPFGTISPWIIMHYILQREEDQGRGRTVTDQDKVTCDEVPNPLMLLFIAHEQLGNRGWCIKSDGKLLYFTLDVVVPRLRSPSLAKSLEQITQYMEQCVYCLFGNPGKKAKIKYPHHNNTPYQLDWNRGQQIYEIFRPQVLPLLEGKVTSITTEIEQLFLRILALVPPEIDPQKYVPEMKKFIKGVTDILPSVPPLLPYKMKDIYLFLGDYYFKKEDVKMSVKYNLLDITINNDRLISWAEISLAKTVILERILNSCMNLNNEKEILNPAKYTIRCFKRTLELKPTRCDIWIEYGVFVYTIHSFCSRLLKQASESLSMEDFESLEKQKEDMLDTTHKCFTTVVGDFNSSIDSDKSNDESWHYYYMLGKVAEKKNKSPSVYLDYYMQGVKSLEERDATYPLKINYSTPSHLCIEVLELHYRIHASILKYIEHHENKPIPASVGKVFTACIEEWKNGPFSKKPKKDIATETDVTTEAKPEPIHAANILKRSVSDAGEEETIEAKRLKLESAAAKVRRSASYDTERMPSKEAPIVSVESVVVEPDKSSEIAMETEVNQSIDLVTDELKNTTEVKKVFEESENVKTNLGNKKESDTEKKEESSSAVSSSSSSDSSSSSSSSDSSSDSSRDSNTSTSSGDSKPLTDDEIMTIVGACLDALEDCASRLPPHYKAIYRLAHYHFYYKKGKDIERCRDLMLLSFTSRSGQKLGGLFSERKSANFFNNIWKNPLTEVDRGGSFAFHMSRSVQLTMEILKEIDDHKSLLDLSMQLQRTPEREKKYLRDSDREELAQQAFSLCVQSLKGQLTKFSQQADLKSNDVERQALKSLTLDIYKAYLKAQKQMFNSKQFTNLLVEAYKLICPASLIESANLVDLTMKYCQLLNQSAKQITSNLDRSQNAQKKQMAKAAESTKTASTVPVPSVPKAQPEPKVPVSSVSGSALPKMSSSHNKPFQNYLPLPTDAVINQQAAAALSYLNNIRALADYSLQNTLHSSVQTSLHNTFQNSFQAELYRQFMGQNFSNQYIPPTKKQKRGPKPSNPWPATFGTAQAKRTKSMPSNSATITKTTSAAVSSIQKNPSLSLAPSMGTVLSSLPASMSANLSSFGGSSQSTSVPYSAVHTTVPSQAHMSSSSVVTSGIHSKPPMPLQQVSPGKTLQEKLAERQKNLPKAVNPQEINASISKLPSSLTITKTSVPKQIGNQGKKSTDAKKSLPFSAETRPKPITSDEVIVLDDD